MMILIWLFGDRINIAKLNYAINIIDPFIATTRMGFSPYSNDIHQVKI